MVYKNLFLSSKATLGAMISFVTILIIALVLYTKILFVVELLTYLRLLPLLWLIRYIFGGVLKS